MSCQGAVLGRRHVQSQLTAHLDYCGLLPARPRLVALLQPDTQVGWEGTPPPSHSPAPPWCPGCVARGDAASWLQAQPQEPDRPVNQVPVQASVSTVRTHGLLESREGLNERIFKGLELASALAAALVLNRRATCRLRPGFQLPCRGPCVAHAPPGLFPQVFLWERDACRPHWTSSLTVQRPSLGTRTGTPGTWTPHPIPGGAPMGGASLGTQVPAALGSCGP